MSVFSHKKRKHSRGQSLVELALIFPICLLFFCGVLDFGLALTRNIVLVTATSHLALAIEDSPDMVNDETECTEYLLGYFPAGLKPVDTEVTVTPLSATQTQVYDYKLWADSPGSATGGEFKERETKYSYRDYQVTVRATCDFITPIGKVIAFVAQDTGDAVGHDYVVEKTMQLRIDGALVGGMPW